MNQHQKYSLGLDLGIASVGAAVVTQDKILGIYVRAFDKAENPKDGKPLNLDRRMRRSTRNRLKSRRLRLREVRKLLINEKITNEKSLYQVINEGNFDPWELRSRALDSKLTHDELAVAIYHIVKHRGFLSTRKSKPINDSEMGAVLKGVEANLEKLRNSGYRSIGELYFKDPRFKAKRRNTNNSYLNTISRPLLKDELELILQSQERLGLKLSTGFREKIVDLLMTSKPALPDEDLLNMVELCTFEPNEKRCPKACFSFEKFKWLTKIRNLSFVDKFNYKRSISMEEFDRLKYLAFETTEKITYSKIRKVLELDDKLLFSVLDYSNYQRCPDDIKLRNKTEDEEFFSAKAFHKLRLAMNKSKLGSSWERLKDDEDGLNLIFYALTVYKEDEKIQEYLRDNSISDEIIEVALELSFSKFSNLSLVAIKKINKHLEEFRRYDEAVKLAGYAHHSDLITKKSLKKIPTKSLETFKRNPVVYRALNQATKVLNAIVDEYGSPAEVHIELARDAHKSFSERQELTKQQNANKKNNNKLYSQFKETFNQREPIGSELTAFRLYKEQDGKCPYCNKPLDLRQIFLEPSSKFAEIDHILPFSRTFDDSISNKVLVHTRHNQDKSNQTPFEFFNGPDSSEWTEFCSWVNTSNLSFSKKKKLLNQDLANKEDSFRERNLNDTRFICKAFKNIIEEYLQFDSERKNCTVVSGQFTSFLRHKWGLTKDREKDDLHHGQDAVVIALCQTSMIQEIAQYSENTEQLLMPREKIESDTGEIKANYDHIKVEMPTPWPNFRNDLRIALSKVMVSRAVTRRNLGSAHDDTIRSKKYIGNSKSSVRCSIEKVIDDIFKTLYKKGEEVIIDEDRIEKIDDRIQRELEQLVGYDDPRNKQFIVLVERFIKSKIVEKINLKAYESAHKGNKTDEVKSKLLEFRENLKKPMIITSDNLGDTTSVVKSLKFFDTQKSGIEVRNGISNNGSMVRVDVYFRNSKYYLVPVYVHQLASNAIPTKAISAGKDESNWLQMNPKEFIFSLYPNDYCRLIKKDGEVIVGYYVKSNRANASITISEPNNRNSTRSGIGVQNLKSLKKYEVDILGRVYKIRTPQHYI